MQDNKLNNTKTMVEAINQALVISMKKDKQMICYGLGINDPKAIFGTTKNLKKKFGEKRVFDVPTSENALTGIAIGAALDGIRSVTVHQRLDFFLLAMDQLVNSAAKWYYTYGINVPITIRLIIGRGWGQGPTHSQNLQAWFAHIPGLKVIMPSNPRDAKGLLISSIFDPNPVIFLEHRWLHNSTGKFTNNEYKIPIGKGKIVKKGRDITIVAMSYLVVESIKASKYLSNFNISCEIIDLRTLKPIDYILIKKSLKKSQNLLVLDTGYTSGSIAGEIIAKMTMECFEIFKNPPSRLAMPDSPEPSSFGLTKSFYIRSYDIALEVCKILKIKNTKQILQNLEKEPDPHDIPGDWFKGPF